MLWICVDGNQAANLCPALYSALPEHIQGAFFSVTASSKRCISIHSIVDFGFRIATEVFVFIRGSKSYRSLRSPMTRFDN